MRLEAIKTYGFKSFADKTELTFNEGITAIVGPNGSGKSNISDAVRWVLGEQSARYLRGSKMEDVIFSGSGQRRALGTAEVTLLLDNSDRTLPLDFEKVALTRRLFRSGESEYAINKKSCRLKDLADLLADTGLGRGTMALIGQNKIDEILNSRPEERRALFEEAAGIAKYRLRKKDAVRRLEITATNLTRIYDIKTEAARQVEPLRLAALKTEKFNVLNAELRGVRLTNFLRALGKLEAEAAQYAQTREALEQELALAANNLAEKQALAVLAQQHLDDLAEGLSELQAQTNDKEKEIESNKGKISVLAERSEQSAKQKERLVLRSLKLEERVAELEKQLAQLTADFDKSEKTRINTQAQTEKLTADKNKLETEQAETQLAEENLRSTYIDDIRELLQQRNELAALEREQEQRVRRRAALKSAIEKSEEEAENLAAQYNKLLESLSRCQLEIERCQAEISALRQNCVEQMEERRKLLNDQQDCQRRLTAAETRAHTLTRLQKSYEGFGYGSKNILQAQTDWRSGVIGAIAELITVKADLVTAIETALGEGAQNIVTDTAETAKQAIMYLKTTGGRATFLPLDSLQKRLPNAEETKLTKLPGVLGFADKLVQFDKRAEQAVRFLLARVLVAENLDTALAAARAGHWRLRVVTLDGDMVNSGGSLSGGARRQHEGYLSRRREISIAETAAQTLHQEMLEWQEKLENCEAELENLNVKINTVQERRQQYAIKAQGLEQSAQVLSGNQQKEAEHLALLLDERTELANSYLAERDRLKELRARVKERETTGNIAQEELVKLERRLKEIGSLITVVNNQLTDALTSLRGAEEQCKYCGELIKNLDNDILSLQEENKGNLSEGDHLTQIIADCSAEQKVLAAANAKLFAELKELLVGRDEYSSQRSKLLAAQKEAETNLVTAQSQVQQLNSKLQKLELVFTRCDAEREHAEAQLQTEYQLSIEEAKLEDLSEWNGASDKNLSIQESKLVLAISELGPINPGAPQAYDEAKERSEFLEKQYSDLNDSKAKLEGIIEEINSGMKKRFDLAFQQINGYFEQCYRKLFGGGTALLRLSDPANLLDSGIEIAAQPPGKKLQSLYLLSGGERALTVIALLFALLSYRPAPFCILDEIDAALDDANIQRFSDFLKEYAARTQFIVITHRKGTMECADIMYGVTMEESGVSKLLSVKINTPKE